MMAGKDQRKKPGKPGAGGKPKAASGPVIETAPLSRPESGDSPASSHPAVRSKLVGSGGDHPAMSLRGTRPDSAKATAATADAGKAGQDQTARPSSTPPARDAVSDAKPATGTTRAEKPPSEASSLSSALDKATDPPSAGAVPKVTSEPRAGSGPTKTAGGGADRPPPPAPRRGGFWPLALGGVVAAGLGAAATWYVIPNLPEGWRPGPVAEAPAIDTEALKQQIIAELPAPAAAMPDSDAIDAAVGAALADAQSGIEATARAAAEQEVTRRLAEAGAGADSTTELAAALQAQDERIDVLGQRLDDLASASAGDTPTDSAPVSTGAGSASTAVLAPGALDEMRKELDGLQADLDDLAFRPDPEPGASAEDLARIDARIAEAEPRLDALEARLSGLSAAMRAGEALRSGDADALAGATQALTDAGLDDAARLAADVPTLAQLQDSYDRAARAALKAARAASPPDNVFSGIGAFLADQTGARSVRPRGGDDPDAIQSRAGALVEAGDIVGALNELDAMPEAGRDAMSGWLTDANAWVAVQDALGKITQPAISSE